MRVHKTAAKSDISTHTLTWSVTTVKTRPAIRRTISTHTLTWSVTYYHFALHAATAHFNSHAHVERDAHMENFVIIVQNFNSHAHVERDPYALRAWAWGGNFNSHAHVERDYSLQIHR